MNELEKYIRVIPDFPKEGILFRDITTVLSDPKGFHLAIEQLEARLKQTEFDVLVGTEARGFVLGAPLAYNLHKPFVLARKKGKLPPTTICERYDLEYGTTEIEMQTDSIAPGQKAVIIDDLIATGGTVMAAAKLVEKLGGEVVKMLFLIELAGLEGRRLLAEYDVDALLTYPGK